MMTRLPSNDESWVPCSPGTLARYASERRGRRRRLAAAKIAGVTLVAIVALSVGWRLSQRDVQPREFNFGGIACHDVQRLMAQYMVGELPAETSDKIQRHLAECPMCREMMRRMKQKEMEGQVGCADPNCPHAHHQLADFESVTAHTSLGGGPQPRMAWLLTEASNRIDARSHP